MRASDAACERRACLMLLARLTKATFSSSSPNTSLGHAQMVVKEKQNEALNTQQFIVNPKISQMRHVKANWLPAASRPRRLPRR